MKGSVDALVIGAGPAGSATAILLARAGWNVILAEQDVYPRRKVCGECVGAAGLALLDELGVGAAVRAHAGVELRHIGFMSGAGTLIADFPACSEGPYRYGRALRREHLDQMLVDRAAALGVSVMQPVRVRAVHAEPGAFRCELASGTADADRTSVRASLVIDAHGSWQRAPAMSRDPPSPRRPHRASDLFAFKAVFRHTRLRPGLLPVMALPGGYGGMVIADQHLATVACCLRRDTLAACRAAQPRAAAGEAVEAWLRCHCPGVRESLEGAQRLGSWLTVGPLDPGRRRPRGTLLRVGNAAGESHPLIGEGIGMALRSAVLLVSELADTSPTAIEAHEVQRRYSARWDEEFSRRMRMAAMYAQVAMRPGFTRPSRALIRRWPMLLTQAARLADKTRIHPPFHALPGYPK